jgi:hypothetical protein
MVLGTPRGVAILSPAKQRPCATTDNGVQRRFRRTEGCPARTMCGGPRSAAFLGARNIGFDNTNQLDRANTVCHSGPSRQQRKARVCQERLKDFFQLKRLRRYPAALRFWGQEEENPIAAVIVPSVDPPGNVACIELVLALGKAMREHGTERNK